MRLIVPWKVNQREKEQLTPFKFSTADGESFKIYEYTLDSFDLGDILQHVVSFEQKICQAVTDREQRQRCFGKVFGRTLARPLQATWESFTAQLGVPVNEGGFFAMVKAMIASFATEDDRRDLLNQIRDAQKPREVPVQTMWYRMIEVNNMVEYLPGQDPKLTPSQLLKAFHDAMPQRWRDRFLNAGLTVNEAALPKILQYFRMQERNAEQNSQANETSGRNGTRNRTNNNPARKANTSVVKKHKPDDAEKGKKSASNGRISDDTKCPIHPNGKHTWGECYANGYNKNATTKRGAEKTKEKQPKKAKTDDKPTVYNVDVDSDDESQKADKATKSNILNAGKLIQPSADNITLPHSHHIDCFSMDAPQIEPIPDKSAGQTYLQYVGDLYATGIEEWSAVDSSNIIKEQVNDHSGSSVVSDLVPGLRLKPIGILIAESVQGVKSKQPLKVLFDTGSDITLFHRSALPPMVTGTPSKQAVNTAMGKGQLTEEVIVHTLTFPEFSPTRRVDAGFKAFIFDAPSPYDIILGVDVMQKLGIDPKPSSCTIQWGNLIVPWKPLAYLSTSTSTEATTSETNCFVLSDHDDEDFETSFFIGQTTKILEAKYEAIDLDQVVASQRHLNSQQQRELHQILNQYGDLFNGNLARSGRLGTYLGPKVHLELIEGARPFQQRPYPVPESNKKVFKQELDRLESIGVLTRTGPSEWLSPTFIIPKKDGTVRWVSDFRALNKLIRRKVYHLPRIQDILKKRKGYLFFTKIDISMQYYTFELDDESKELCTICTPFGNYRYNRLPMGIKQSPDVAQEIMENLFRDFLEVDVYIDDVGIFNDDWSSHLTSLNRVLAILQKHNFTVNPLKCEWGVQETDWLGYWLTPTGIKPWKKKIAAILALNPPTTVKELRSFIGAVTFYRDMYPKRSHILAPLTAQVGQKKLLWSQECQKAFETAKALLAKDAFLRYPDHNKPFHVYCDASDLQLGAAILQEGVPVAFYSRKLNSAQRNYTVGEKEILSIVETLKEYRTMLFGCKELHVHTDHKNLTFQRLNTQRVMRWRLFLEEYHPIFHYIQGEKNSLADALSRLPFSERQSNGPKDPIDLYRNPSQGDNYSDDPFEDQESGQQSKALPTSNYFSMAIDDDDLRDCFVHLPDQAGAQFALDYKTIAEAQARDAELVELQAQHPAKFIQQMLAPDTMVYCFIKEPNAPWKIYLPNELLDDAVRFYHLALSHVGMNRLYDTLSLHFYNRHMRNKVEDLVARCDTCQRQKLVGRGHGHLPPREAELAPWREVAVDCIGPWQLRVGQHIIEFKALTITDTVTNLTEIVRVENSTAAHIALHFENTWLSRYPRPIHLIYDQGGEFTGYAFQKMLQRHNIHGHCISAKNPQANSVAERMHQVVGNALRTLVTLQPPVGAVDAKQLCDTAIANAMHATRATFHSALHSTPGGLAFGRDMFLDIPLVADLLAIQQNRQQLINQRLIVANRKRFSHDYAVGEEVLKLVHRPGKMDARAEGPYPIERVHTNGTLTIRLNPRVIERINIRRVKPYRR